MSFRDLLRSAQSRAMPTNFDVDISQHAGLTAEQIIASRDGTGSTAPAMSPRDLGYVTVGESGPVDFGRQFSWVGNPPEKAPWDTAKRLACHCDWPRPCFEGKGPHEPPPPPSKRKSGMWPQCRVCRKGRPCRDHREVRAYPNMEL